MNASAGSLATRSRRHVVVSSSLWAAAGDALGWITELASPGTIKARAGVSQVSRPVKWQRIVGGRGGPKVPLPAGTYSDDTQLRLAVGRSIRGSGMFDAEAFARIELTVWQGYALGAGLGSKAAAANLSRRGVNWFSNFYETKGQTYLSGGGNGAAMRIQPHVWSYSIGQRSPMETEVLKDAITTHGHPHGFSGALFHAACVSHSMRGQLASPIDWFRFVDGFIDAEEFISADPQLREFWLPNWEEKTQRSIRSALSEIRSETLSVLDSVAKITDDQSYDGYRSALSELGCLNPKYRGSGIRTAIAAAVASWIYRNQPIERMLADVSNVVDSDTDTIATMAGAISGCVSDHMPDWEIQDRAYIQREAIRMADLSRGATHPSTTYPDLAKWSPPATQSDAVTLTSAGFRLEGLGAINPVSEEYAAGEFVWQWFETDFGQTILAKRRAGLGVQPTPLRKEERRAPSAYGDARPVAPARDVGQPGTRDEPRDWLGAATDKAIQSGFDDRTIGRLFNECIDRLGTIEGAVAFASIVAKAKLSRRRAGR